MKTVGIGAIHHRSEPVRITLDEMAQWWERPSTDGGERLVSCTLAARIDGRTVVSEDWAPEWAARLRGCGLVDAPVHLGLRAVLEGARDRGRLRIDVAATPTTEGQEEVLAGIADEVGDVFWLWSGPWSRFGLHLGTALLPAPPELLANIPVDPDVGARLRARERALQPYFDRILWGDPRRAIEGVIRSTRGGPERTSNDQGNGGAR